MEPLTNATDAVSRAEFEQHQRQVSKDIEGLSKALQLESEARSQDTRLIRKDIKDITFSSGKPQYQMMGLAFAVFSFLIVGAASLYARGDNMVQSERDRRIERMESAITKEIDRTKDWQEGHDLRVRGLNAAQWERIRGLERVTYPGGSLPITAGAARGSESKH